MTLPKSLGPVAGPVAADRRPGWRRRRRIEATCSVAVALVAAVAAWISFGQADMSLDEGYTLAEAHLGFRSLLHVLWGRELNGSLHTAVVWVLIRLPGADHPTAVRALSTVCLMVAFLLLFGVLRRAASVCASLVGLVFFAANPLVLAEMVTGRTYALTTLLVVVSLRLLLTATDSGSLKVFLVWGVMGAAMLYGHFLTGPVLAAEVIWLTVAHPRLWRRWAAGTAVTGVLAVPILAFLVTSGSRQNQLPPTATRSVQDYASGVLALIASGARGQGVVQYTAVVVVAGCLVLGVRATSTRPVAVLGLSVATSSVLFAALAAQAIPSIFSLRYLPLCIAGARDRDSGRVGSCFAQAVGLADRAVAARGAADERAGVPAQREPAVV